MINISSLSTLKCLLEILSCDWTYRVFVLLDACLVAHNAVREHHKYLSQQSMYLVCYRLMANATLLSIRKSHIRLLCLSQGKLDIQQVHLRQVLSSIQTPLLVQCVADGTL